MFGLALGILTAIGGFLDIGDLVTNAVVGSRFGLSLGWAVVVGVIGICIFAQMSGRVAAVSGRATFELIRERLGPRVAILNLGASFLINLMTLTAEVGGVALAVQLITSATTQRLASEVIRDHHRSAGRAGVRLRLRRFSSPMSGSASTPPRQAVWPDSTESLSAHMPGPHP